MPSVPYGNLTVYAVANMDAESFRNTVSLKDFKETVILHYLSAFKEYIPMKATADFVLDSSVKSVSLSLERLMSRLQLVRVRNRLVGLLEGEDIRLKRAYLTNIQGGFYVDMKANATVWYSKFGRYDFLPSETSYITSADDLITGFHSFRDIDDVSVIPGMDASLGDLESFYAFPNHTPNDETGWQSGRFTERYTRMVLVAEIKGTEYYYPVNLLNMVSNHSYDVVYTISRLGSDDPDTFTSVAMQENEIDFEEIEDGGEIEIKF